MSKPRGNPSQNDSPLPTVPPGAIRVAKIGGTIALFAAAAMSAQTLVALGHLLGYHGKIAWLLPASLDVYAGTSIWVGYRIPAAHPASVTARRDAVLALTLTVCCNALFHLLLLAGTALPKPLIDGLLVAVGALPPLVVERILHLQMSVRGGDTTTSAEVVAEAAAPERKPSAAAAETLERKPAPEASASIALPSAATTGSPSASSRIRPAFETGSRAGSRRAASGPVPIQRADRLEEIRGWIAEAGGVFTAVPLKDIQDRFGVSQATASRMRSEAAGPVDGSKAADDEEPQRVLEATS